MLFNLDIKKSIMFIILNLIILENNCCAGGKKYREECCLSRSLRRIGGGIKGLFKCCFQETDRHPYRRISDGNDLEEGTDVLANGTLLGIFPKDVLLYLSKFLPPPDVINLRKCSRELSYLSTDQFWNDYNTFHRNMVWDHNVLPIRVAFSYYWLKIGKFQKSATLGLPAAKALIEEEKRNIRINQAKHRPVQNYRDNNIYGGTSAYLQNKIH